jgi:SnoaL-like domain
VSAFTAPQELHDLAFRYALSVDNHDAEMIKSVFTRGGAVRGFGENPIHFAGSAGLDDMIARVKSSFRRTMHNVHNQTFERDETGNVTGITYCIASHILPGEAWQVLDMALRYHNIYAQEDGMWRYADRALEVLWVETRDVQPFSPDMMSSEFEEFK